MNTQDAMKRVHILVKVRAPYIYVVSHEEDRLIQKIGEQIAVAEKKQLLTWSCHRGFVDANGKCVDEKTKQVGPALNYVANFMAPSGTTGTIFVMKDLHYHLSPIVARQLRDMYHNLQRAKIPGNTGATPGTKSVIIIAPSLSHIGNGLQRGLEPSLEKQVEAVYFPLPDKQEISTYLKKELEPVVEATKEAIRAGHKVPSCTLEYSKEEIEDFSKSLQGLCETEIALSFLESLKTLQKLDVNFLMQRKKDIVRRSDILEVVDNIPNIEDVGGLDAVKDFLQIYSGQFSEEAISFGIEPLRGIILTGVPGTGKSLVAKTIGSVWKLPVLRLDIGKVMAGIVGQSEERMRQAIQIAQATAPVVLWCDEIEKSLSGTGSSNVSDGGTISRVFGTLLTAMEESLKNVVVVATANDISALPPELIRRFDEVFFVNLPTREERKEILDIHLRKRGRKNLKFKWDELLDATDTFTGSEIEKVVKEGLARAWQAKRSEVTLQDLLSAARDTRPISKVMEVKIRELRDWARDRARFASSKKDEPRTISPSEGRPKLGETLNNILKEGN